MSRFLSAQVNWPRPIVMPGESPTKSTNQNTTYESWIAQVNVRLIHRVSMSVDDMEDQSYADWYESGMSPANAVHEIVGQLNKAWGF